MNSMCLNCFRPYEEKLGCPCQGGTSTIAEELDQKAYLMMVANSPKPKQAVPPTETEKLVQMALENGYGVEFKRGLFW